MAVKSLGEYSLSDWLQVKPVIHGYKAARNDLVQAVFNTASRRTTHETLRGILEKNFRHVFVAIAFEQPWVVEWLRDALSQYAPAGSALLIADNSAMDGSRLAHQNLEDGEFAFYLPLPPNPWIHFNRSHGSSMSWVFHQLRPFSSFETLSFIDHDLIPVRKIRTLERLQDQPFYGLLNQGKSGYNLWAGFCHYRWSDIQHRRLNFLTDVPRGLDTGGRNFGRFYRDFEQSRMRFADQRVGSFQGRSGDSTHLLEVIDDTWIHLGRTGHHASRLEERKDFYAFLRESLKDGRDLKELEEEQV